MKRHYRYFIRGSVLTVLIIVCLVTTGKILVPKYYYNGRWASTVTYQGFYEMDKDTIDVLFFGSSHAVSAFNMQRLYDEYGITGYNLGCEEQNILLSYYWLKEALRFQSPKAVVLELRILFPYNVVEPLNSAESNTRKAMDYMKWGPVKVNAIKDICGIDENQSALSYYLTNLRFHTRWEDLSEDDFSNELSYHYELKGFCPRMEKVDDSAVYMPFETGTSDDMEASVYTMMSYLELIIELCKEEGIELILVETPAIDTGIGEYNTAMKIAEENNIAYYDFNEEQLYNRIGFDFISDMADGAHASLAGSIKIMDFLGNLLSTEYGIEKKSDMQWEETRDFYESILREYEIIYTTDIYTYLDLINNERYSTFISVRNEASAHLDEEMIALMKKLGLSPKLENQYQASYLAVISGDNIYEEVGYEKLEYYGTIRNGRVSVELVSAGAECGSMSSIIIDRQEYSVDKRGLNIVVYDNLLKKVIDSVNFDTSVQELEAIR